MKKSSTKPSRSRGAHDENEGAPLDAYRKKRHPGRTTEPFSAERAPSASGTYAGAFVCHLHDASRRHYDLRLQVGGTLKSFAVPRGPSLNPKDKRLAVNTEDHPLEYLDFENVIPDGNYGAGPMIVWDTGRVRYLDGTAEQGYRAGKLDFVLAGYKLRGRFALVKTGDRKGKNPSEANQWLLIKKSDAFASETLDIIEAEPRSVISGLAVEELEHAREIAAAVETEAAAAGAPEGDIDASKLTPMLCALSGADLDDPERLYELKLDGVRIIADRRGDTVALRYRTKRPATVSYPEIVRAVRALPAERIVLDGEIIALDESGRPSFERLGRRIHALRPRDAAQAAGEVPVIFVVFDVLQIGSRDLRPLPLIERKRLLSRLVPDKGMIRVLDHVDGRGSVLFALCKEQRLEGIVAKRKHAPYRLGPRRTEDWVKVKCEREADFVVVSWLAGKGARRSLGALELASWDGHSMVRRGRVGSGLDDASIRILLEKLSPLEVDAPTAEGTDPRPGPRHHVRPEVVVSVEYMGFTEDGNLRHPVFRGIRNDVDPKSCTTMPASDLLEQAPAPLPVPEKAAAPEKKIRAARVHVTNRGKVFWPDEGYTKGDLLDYYAAISDTMLPYLRDRPIVLVRYPDGIAGKSFYQWNVPEGTPDWIETHRFRDEDGREGKHTFIVNDADGLVHIANLGCIPIHILACRRGSEEFCDFLTIDFDIGARPFRDAVVLALSLRELLEELGLSGYPKTSGQSGLHVLIPMGGTVPFDTAKMLLELMGRVIQMKHRDIATMERRISGRGDRVYIDTGQTGRSRTIVAPYSVRAHPGATVSMPLAWDEVHLALDPRQFTMFSVAARVAERGDAMEGLLSERPDVAAAVQRLGAKLRV